jgi:hypothetical protein
VKISIKSVAGDDDWIEAGSTMTNEFGEFFAMVDPRKIGPLTAGEHIVTTNANNDNRYNLKNRYRVVS